MRNSPDSHSSQEQERFDRLKENFHGIFTSSKLNPKSIEQLFTRITQLYQSPERAYHNLEHIEHLLSFLQKHKAIEGDTDCEIFLDADLSILGACDSEYDEYARKIRQEYSWVPTDQYKAGRKQILERFLTRRRIYLNKEIHDQLNTQARRNIQREISQL